MVKNRIFENVKSDCCILIKICSYLYVYYSIRQDDLIGRVCWIWTKSGRSYQSDTFLIWKFVNPDRDNELKSSEITVTVGAVTVDLLFLTTQAGPQMLK